MKQALKRFFSFPVNTIARVCLVVWIFGVTGHSSAAAESFDDRRPNEHFCPITLQVMRDPVVAADGHSYERMAILEHFKNGMGLRSPITGLLLPNKNLFDNQALKTMIMDWKPGRQGEPSVLETREAASIAERVKEEFQKNAALLNSAKGKNIVAFLGNTGAGKSTLVNLLAGKEIVASDDGEDYVLAHPEDKTAMIIGTGGNSETLYPKFIDVDGLRFFDLPGFNDTDGTERNLVNAAFTRKILLDAASVRFVVVAGQDQFTADRSASIRQLFDSIRQLFVVNERNVNLVDDGVFVATKITCNEKTPMMGFLLKKTSSRDKADLYQQLKSWGERNRLCRMFHPIREAHNKGARDHILKLIKETRAAKILGINVSVLYPPDTKEPLERMFFSLLENAFNRNLKASLVTLSDQECYSYDKSIAFYGSGTFWSTFDVNVRAEEDAIELLKEFCVNPYNKARITLEKENEEKRQQHIQNLQIRKQKNIENIERMFFNLLQGTFYRNLKESLINFSDQQCCNYDEDIDFYGSDTFWSEFDATVRTQENTINLLKKFCAEHYHKSLATLEKENEGKRQEHIQTLRDWRQKKIEDIERIFLSDLESAFNSALKHSLTSLSGYECYIYDEDIDFYGSDTFWSEFDATVRTQENIINLFKKFCAKHYHTALTTLEKKNEGKRQEHIQGLRDRKQKKIEEIEKMFLSELESAFNRNLNVSLMALPSSDTTLSDYNKAIAFYKLNTFWLNFDATVRTQKKISDLLRKFCREHYHKALTTFEKENEGKRQEHIQSLRNRRKKRREDIEKRTDERVREVIASLIPRKEKDDFVAFDFAWHRDYYDQVCAPASIKKLATDPQEQEVVRRYYAEFISRHSHKQMMRWHQKFSREEELNRRMIAMEMMLTVARGHEEIYQRFLNGALLYRPNGDGNDEGVITLPIRDLGNPLEGTFDLSRCGDAGKYLSISTGYRKGKKPKNESKIEIWFAPRFLIEKELNTTAKHFKPRYGQSWTQVGIFWTWGGWDQLTSYDYLTTKNMEDLSKNNLLENWSLIHGSWSDNWDGGEKYKERLRWFTFVL